MIVELSLSFVQLLQAWGCSLKGEKPLGTLSSRGLPSASLRSDMHYIEVGSIHCRFFRGRRQGRQPFNPARGPLAVALPKAFLSSP